MGKVLITTDKILALLENNPITIAGLLAGLAPNQLRELPAEGQWSAVELLAHLRSCADVWGDCIRTILAEERPTIRAINPRTWIKKTGYPDLEYQPSFLAFTVQRAELLALLASLTPEDWSRRAIVIGAGRPLERTAQFYAQWLAEHERSHLKQFKQIVNVLAVV